MLRFIHLSILAIFVSQLAAIQLTWHRIPSLGVPSTNPRFGSLGYFAKNRQLIFYGGFSANTHICNITGTASTNLSCTWSKVATLNSPPARGFTYSGVCESEEVFVVAAGRSSAGENLNDIWFFNFQDYNWYEVNITGGPIPHIRYAGGSGVALGECEFFLTMGFGGDIRSSDAFTFDLRNITKTKSGEWRQVGRSFNSYDPSGPHARCLNAGSFLSTNTFGIFGGCMNALGERDNGGPCPTWDSWYFDLTAQTWNQLPTCLSPRSFVRMSHLPNTTGAVLFGGRLDSKVIPTVLAATPPPDELAILDLSTSQKWMRKKAGADPIYGLPAFRRDHHMVTGEGVVFMYGGRVNDSGPSLLDLWYLYGDYKLNEDLGCQHFFTAEMAHGILMFLAFGLCFQAGFVVARYAKFGNAIWFYLHVTLQLTGLFFATFGFILGFLNRSNPVFTHGIIGIIAMGLALWQPINALFRPEHKEGEKSSIFRWIWFFLHMLTGRSALLLGLVNISLGLFLIVAPLSVWVVWYVLLFLYIIFLVVMESVLWIRCYRNKNKKSEKLK